ncbi:MAG: diguanylate cyclase [Candidatus Dormiibacterota bacterium]
MKEVRETEAAAEVLMLRAELAACRELLAEQQRQMTVLEFATQALTYSLDPEQVIQTATSLAATLASPPGGGARRGVYYEVSDGTMRIIADSDDTGASAVGTWMPISEHPLIPKALAAGGAVSGALDPTLAGPRARAIIKRLGLKFAAYVPVRVKATVHGVLVVSSRDRAIPDGLVERLAGLGALTSLALTNALRHREAESDAVTDSLTGLTNRRGFEHAVDQIGARRPFALLAIDVDNLKLINDGYGHAAGDRLLIAIAGALSSVARKGETLARIGGDEFVLLIPGAEAGVPMVVARRMQESVARLNLPTGPARVSVGIASGPAGSDPYLVLQTADAHLYVAKGGDGTAGDDLPATA